MSREDAAASLRRVRRLYQLRQAAADPTDRWFTIYVVLLMVGIYAVPTAIVVGDSLDAASAAALTGDGAAVSVSVGFSLLALMALLLGTVQGPAALTPFLAQTLLDGAIDRRRVLLRPVLIAWLLCLLGGVAAASVAGTAMVRTAEWGSAELLRFLGAGAAAGLHLGLLWLLGQRWGRGAGATMTLLALLPAAWAVLPPLEPAALWLTPGGWLGLVWADQGASAAWAVSAAVGVVGAVGLLAVPSVLQRMPARAVIEQSRRVADARLYSSTGSFDDAAELFRDRPRHRGNALMRWALRGPTTGLRGAFSGFVADVAAATRTPRRLVLGFSTMVLGVLLVSLCLGAAGPGSSQEDEDLLLILMPAILLGTALLHLGSGAIADGWRSLKDEFDAAPLFGWAARQATLRRLAWPCAAGLVAVGLGHLTALTASWWLGEHSGTTIRWSLVLTGIVLSARFMQTMRDRQMPLDSLVPIPTPFGDLSGLKVLFWVAEGLVVSLTAALGMLLLPWAWWAVLLTSAACLTVAVATGWSRTGQAWSTGAPRSRCRNTGTHAE